MIPGMEKGFLVFETRGKESSAPSRTREDKRGESEKDLGTGGIICHRIRGGNQDDVLPRIHPYGRRNTRKKFQ